jgi:hypothetical protein
MPSTHTNQVPAPHDVQTSAEAAPTASDHVPSLHEIQSSLDKARRVLDQEPGRPNHNKKKKNKKNGVTMVTPPFRKATTNMAHKSLTTNSNQDCKFHKVIYR